MPSGITLLASTTLSSAQSSIEFTSISGSYKHLWILATLRGTENNTTGALRLNSDTGTNYAQVQNYTYITAPGTGASRYTTGSQSQFRNNSGHVEDTTRSANLFGQIEIYIFNYAGTSYKKSVVTKNVHALDGSQTSMSDTYGIYNSASAITTVTIKGDSGSNLNAGSSAYLYGIA